MPSTISVCAPTSTNASCTHWAHASYSSRSEESACTDSNATICVRSSRIRFREGLNIKNSLATINAAKLERHLCPAIMRSVVKTELRQQRYFQSPKDLRTHYASGSRTVVTQLQCKRSRHLDGHLEAQPSVG